MFIYCEGDIFASDADALINTVNCKGVMGKGFVISGAQATVVRVIGNALPVFEATLFRPLGNTLPVSPATLVRSISNTCSLNRQHLHLKNV